MKRIALFVLILAMSTPTQSWAHTPVELLDTDTSAAAGPLITDGTVTFTMKATFANSGQRKAFRAAFKSGDNVSIEYLVADRKPDKSWRASTLPTVAITSPSGAITNMKLTKAKKYFEKGTKTNYLILSEFTTSAEEGIYSVTVTSKSKSTITVAIGENYSVRGEISRATSL